MKNTKYKEQKTKTIKYKDIKIKIIIAIVSIVANLAAFY